MQFAEKKHALHLSNRRASRIMHSAPVIVASQIHVVLLTQLSGALSSGSGWLCAALPWRTPCVNSSVTGCCLLIGSLGTELQEPNFLRLGSYGSRRAHSNPNDLSCTLNKAFMPYLSLLLSKQWVYGLEERTFRDPLCWEEEHPGGL